MKKYFILLTMLFIITGCKANAHITIDKNTVTEKVSIYAEDTAVYNNIKNGGTFPVPLYYDEESEDPIWMPERTKETGVSYYDVNFNDNTKVIDATGRFSIGNYNRSSLVRNCFDLFNVITEKDGTVIFSTSKGLTCDTNNFSIVIDTPYTVLTNNAHRVDNQNNIYTWNVTDSNSDNVSVFMQIDFSKKYNETAEPSNNNENNYYNETEKEKSPNHIVIYIIIGILLITTIIGIIVLNKKRKDNLSI